MKQTYKIINLALGLLLLFFFFTLDFKWFLILRLIEDVDGCKMKVWAETFVFYIQKKKNKLTEQFVLSIKRKLKGKDHTFSLHDDVISSLTSQAAV